MSTGHDIEILFRYFHWYFAIYFMLFMVIGKLDLITSIM